MSAMRFVGISMVSVAAPTDSKCSGRLVKAAP